MNRNDAEALLDTGMTERFKKAKMGRAKGVITQGELTHLERVSMLLLMSLFECGF